MSGGTGFSFGTSGNKPGGTGGGGFGFNTPTNTGGGGGGGFSTPQGGNTNTNTNTGGFGFSTGGSSTPQNKTGGGFGFGTNTPATGGNTNTNTNTGGGFGFGTTSSSTPGWGNTGGGSNWGGGGGGGGGFNNQQGVITPMQKVDPLLARVHLASPANNFVYMFYNRVNPSEVSRYTMQCPNNIHPKLWATALENNPDPDTLVPTPAIGFDGLTRRVKVQEQEIEGQKERLRETEKFITDVIEKRSLETAIKLEEYKRQSNQLEQRLLQLASRVELLRARGVPTQPDEDMWRQRLLSLQAELQKPNQFKGRLNELASRVRMHQETYASAMSVDKEVLSEQDSNQVAQFLAEQRRGLSHLTDVIKNDARNLSIMLTFMNEPLKRG